MLLKRVLIADDHPLFRAAMENTLSQHYQETAFANAGDVDSLLAILADDDNFDLLLLDLNMPGSDGFSTLLSVVQKHPMLPVIMVSADDDGDIINAAIASGAAGFISKAASIETIYQAIDDVLMGDIYHPYGLSLEDCQRDLANKTQLLAQLTPSQLKVAKLLVKGLLTKQIADQISVTEATVKAHITSIYKKLGVSSRTQAVVSLNKQGLS